MDGGDCYGGGISQLVSVSNRQTRVLRYKSVLNLLEVAKYV